MIIMKKEYASPEWEFYSFKLKEDLLTASKYDPEKYDPEPENPGRTGDDSGEGEIVFP